MTQSDDGALAQRALATGDFSAARAAALRGLTVDPDDVELHRLVGRSSLELGLDDATHHLAVVAHASPDDVGAWRELGLAAVEMGDLERASEAFEKVVELDAADEASLVHLAHVWRSLGRTTEAMRLLSDEAKRGDAAPETLRALLDLADATGDDAMALLAATKLAGAEPKDVVAALTVADLLLDVGHLEEAAEAFAGVRHIDEEDGHAGFSHRGQAEALLRAGQWRRALDVLIEATRADREHLTTELLRYAAAKLFGETERSAPAWDDLEQELRHERDTHRRMHAEQELL